MEGVVTAKSLGSFICGHCDGCKFNVYMFLLRVCYNTPSFHYCVLPRITEILYQNDLDEVFFQTITLAHNCYTRTYIEELAANL